MDSLTFALYKLNATSARTKKQYDKTRSTSTTSLRKRFYVRVVGFLFISTVLCINLISIRLYDVILNNNLEWDGKDKKSMRSWSSSVSHRKIKENNRCGGDNKKCEDEVATSKVSIKNSKTSDSVILKIEEGKFQVVNITTETTVKTTISTTFGQADIISSSSSSSSNNGATQQLNQDAILPIVNTDDTRYDGESPHATALDADGNEGYVGNLTNLRSWMVDRYCSNDNCSGTKSGVSKFMNFIEEEEICEIEPKHGIEGEGWNIMTQILEIKRGLLFDKNAPKVLCVVYNNGKSLDSIRGIAETWGWRCDGFFTTSNKTSLSFDLDETLSELKLPDYAYPPVEMIQLTQDIPSSWQQSRSLVSYIYDHYLHEYDYFLICNADTHVIVENLKQFLVEVESNQTSDSNEPIVLFSGQIMNTTLDFVGEGDSPIIKSNSGIWLHGGAGHLMSREALKRYVELALPICYPNLQTEFIDVFFSKCMHYFADISPTDAADSDGKQRFHSMNPHYMETKNNDNYFTHPTIEYWASIHGRKEGANLVSSHSISFNNINTLIDLKRYHAIVYKDDKMCDKRTRLGQALSTVHNAHTGAIDANGKYGYVANVTSLRSWMVDRYCTDNNCSTTSEARRFLSKKEKDDVCGIESKLGVEGEGWDVMTRIVSIKQELLFNEVAPKVLCGVYTYGKRHDSIRGIAETWGWRCDGFFAASDKTTTTFELNETIPDPDYSFPPVEMIHLTHEGFEEYQNMWQKTRSIVSYIYDHYLFDYDYFFICGDDTHVIVENLKHFLYEQERNRLHTNEPIILFSGAIANTSLHFVGEDSAIIRSNSGIWVDGGGGYVVSREALKRFVEIALPACYPHSRVPFEDILFTKCLHYFVGIAPTDAADSDGKQRFHNVNPHYLATKQNDNYFTHATLEYWASIHGKKEGSDLVSSTTISFHGLKTAAEMKRHHAILYKSDGMCDNTTTLGKALSFIL